MPPSAERSRLRRDFWIASAVHAAVFVWVMRSVLFSTGVYAQFATTRPPQSLHGFSEMVYELLPAIHEQTRLIRQGHFPGWDPDSNAGTPLIGKMQNGVFAPYHLLIYLLPLEWLVPAFTAVYFLKSYLAFVFAFLFCRCLGLGRWAGILAGIWYVLPRVVGGMFSWFGVNAYLPLLLLLIELFFHGRRTFALLWMPWAMALPFFSGHFESAFWMNLSGSAYFLLRLRSESAKAPGQAANRAGWFVVAAAAAAGLAFIQIGPGMEYVDLSYNRVWHLWEFWEHELIAKHITSDDLPMILAGLTGFAAFAWAFRRFLRASEAPPVRVAAGSLSAAFLAFGLACWMNLGLNATMARLAYSMEPGRITTVLSGFVLVFLAFREWGVCARPGLRCLGWLMLANLALTMKEPLVSNLLLRLPFFKNFHNSSYQFTFELGMAVLAAAAVERMPARAAAEPRDRLRQAGAAACVLGIFIAAFLGAWPLRRLLLSAIPTGVHVPRDAAATQAGGFMGPEFEDSRAAAYSVAGWVPGARGVASVAVAFIKDNQVASQAPAKLKSSGGRVYFSADVPMPAQGGSLTGMAQVRYGDGGEQVLRGMQVNYTPGGDPLRRYLGWGFAAVLVLLLLPGRLIPAAGAIVLILTTLHLDFATAPDIPLPYRLPGIEKIKEDRELFRIASLDYNFMQADYANVYGLSDLRTGGDNLDVLTMIYFYRFVAGLASRPSQTPEFEAGLRLWGLANMKYLVEPPGKVLDHPALEPVHRGEDLWVYRNKHFRPRARFFGRYAYLPMPNWKDWNSQGQFMGPLAAAVGQRQFDPEQTLLVNDLPASGSSGATGSVKVEEYAPSRVRLSVDATGPGLVFLGDNHFPGWKAFLNGRAAPTLRSWLTFRALEVPGGKSEVLFLYRPSYLLAGILASAGISLFWLFLYRKHRPQVPPPGAALLPQGKKRKLVPAPEDIAPLEWEAYLLAETVCWWVVGGMLLFWSGWTAVIYQGPAAVRLAALAALAWLLAILWNVFKSSSAQAQPAP